MKVSINSLSIVSASTESLTIITYGSFWRASLASAAIDLSPNVPPLRNRVSLVADTVFVPYFCSVQGRFFCPVLNLPGLCAAPGSAKSGTRSCPPAMTQFSPGCQPRLRAARPAGRHP